jgi:hypothetical protein
MRREFSESEDSRVLFYDVPDYLLGHLIAPNRTRSAYSSEESAVSHARREQPEIDRMLHPVRHRNCSNMAALPNQINDGPVFFALLDMFQAQLVNSLRRKPQPSRTARIARSRLPLREKGSGSCHSWRASSAVSQLPRRRPSFFDPLTRRMPAARSGLNNPESVASYANRRTAASRTLMVPGARWRSSRWIRYRVTTSLLNESRGEEQYQFTNSSIECW